MSERTRKATTRAVGLVPLLLVLASPWACGPSREEKKTEPAGKETAGGPAATGAPVAAPGGAGAAPAAGPAGQMAAVPPTPGQGMTSLPSGLQFAVVKQGTGSPPPAGSTVKVHLTGWVTGAAGKPPAQFFDTRARGTPQEYTLTRDPLAGLSQQSSIGTKPPLIEGLALALLDMKPGETRKLIVPSNLAYGDRGYPPLVQARSDLSFDVELVSFTPPAAAAPSAPPAPAPVK